MKKILSFALTVIMVLALIGCKGDSDDNIKKPEETPATTEAPASTDAPALTDTPNPTPTPTPIGAAEVEPTAAPSPTDITAEPTQEPEPTQGAGSVSFDPNYDYDPIITAFSDYLRDVYMEDHYDETFEDIRYALGFIDEDSIPELFVSDGDIHAYGAKVFKYVDGEVVFVGEFGQYGGFAFTPGRNNIYSFYYGMGCAINYIYSMNPDGTLVEKGHFESIDQYDYDNDVDPGIIYTVNDEEVDAETYEAELAKFYYDEEENWTLEYLDNFISFSDTCYNRLEVMKYMIMDAVEGKKFTEYITPEMEAMVGDWTLVRADINDSEDNIYGYFDNESAHSVLTIMDDYYMSFWLSAEQSRDGEEKTLIKRDYYLPMTYLPMGIYDGVENDEYSIRCETELEDTDYYMVMFTDDEGVETLELVIFGHLIEDYGWEENIIAYYHRADTAEPVGTKYFGRLETYPQKERNDGTNCYLLHEYLVLTPDSPSELKAAYGFADDLDGYDFEIVEADTEPMIVYASMFTPSQNLQHYTCYTLIEYSALQIDYVDYAKFYERVHDTYEGLFVNVFIEDGSDVANFIEEEYMG